MTIFRTGFSDGLRPGIAFWRIKVLYHRPMPGNSRVEEVGDLFVTESTVTVKLLPSKKSGSRLIRWFSRGCVTNVRSAAKDIAYLVGRLQGRSRVVRGLTVMTDAGHGVDLEKTRLAQAIEKAGFAVLK